MKAADGSIVMGWLADSQILFCHLDVLRALITLLWLSTQCEKVRHRIAAAGFDSLSATLLIGLVSK